MEQQIISAGIDIGTTTSQVIFSRLTLENHSYTAIPDVKIAKKEIPSGTVDPRTGGDRSRHHHGRKFPQAERPSYRTEYLGTCR